MNLKHIPSIVLCLLAITAMAQKPVQIIGSLNKKQDSVVKLFKVKNGKLEVMAADTVGEDKKFRFQFTPGYNGFYVIGTNQPTDPINNYTFYFKGGEKASLTILDSTYQLDGETNSKENAVLKQWHDLINSGDIKLRPVMGVQKTPIDYFPRLEDFTAKAKIFFKEKVTGNAKFDALMKQYINWERANFYATVFFRTANADSAALKKYEPFYKTLDSRNFSKNAASLYQQPWGRLILNTIILVNMRQQQLKPSSGEQGLKVKWPFITNDTLKGDYVVETITQFKEYKSLKKFTDDHKKYIKTRDQKVIISNALALLEKSKAGYDAYQFSFPDVDEKTVTMAELKGKVVLIDVWATWCAPCRAEVPHLKKLAEELKSTDLAVVGITIDKPVSKQNWIKMVKEENLAWSQLFAGGDNNPFSKYYNIKLIPRFLVFDKQGKIVTIDAPRPSDPGLKILLTQLLNQKSSAGL